MSGYTAVGCVACVRRSSDCGHDNTAPLTMSANGAVRVWLVGQSGSGVT